MRKITLACMVMTTILSGATAASAQQEDDRPTRYGLEIPGQPMIWGINPADYRDQGIGCTRPVWTIGGSWQSLCRLGANHMAAAPTYQYQPQRVIIVIGGRRRW